MKYLADLGLKQGVLPPQERPHVPTLRRCGFTGTDREVIEHAGKDAPWLLVQCSNASSMWAANAATIAPSLDAHDGRVHITPANLVTTFHRSLEPQQTSRALQRIFSSSAFCHHDPLPAGALFGDEGAANHTRLYCDAAKSGIHMFVYGRSFNPPSDGPKRYPARQSLEASQAIARLHALEPARTVFLQQAPEAIDQGVFHNDVVCVGNGNVLLFHEQAFLNGLQSLEPVRRAMEGNLIELCVRSTDLSLADAVQSYLFNSQLVTLPNGEMALIAPFECKENDTAHKVIQTLPELDKNPIHQVHYLDVRQSMCNGGGPACLRLRVFLSELEASFVDPLCWMNDALYQQLLDWASLRYREELLPRDLADPALLEESRLALDELTQILRLGSDFYNFQR